MRVIRGFPPNIRKINQTFNVRGMNVFFAWGDTIYAPMGGKLPPELMAHEEVHGRRQNGDPAAWWERYLSDPGFRLQEEIPAHLAELEHLGRPEHALRYIAERLSSTLYGSMVSFEDALEILGNPKTPSLHEHYDDSSRKS
jgi:hypothetical protein